MDNVQIDLAGHSINGPHKNNNFSSCIHSNCNNITISNGTISGFMYGINCATVAPYTYINNIEIYHITFDHNYFRGIRIDNGNDISIHDNKITHTGSFTGFPHSFAMGIEICKGSKVKIHNNIIKETIAVGIGESVGISISDTGCDCKIFGNHIENSQVDDYSRSFGIWAVKGRTSAEIYDNYFKNFTYALVGMNYKLNASADTETLLFLHNTVDGKYCMEAGQDFLSNNTVLDDSNSECHDCPSYFLAAAEAGNSNAAFRLALTMESAEERAEKYRWLSIASKDGHSEATRILKRDAEIYHIAEAEKSLVDLRQPDNLSYDLS